MLFCWINQIWREKHVFLTTQFNDHAHTCRPLDASKNSHAHATHEKISTQFCRFWCKFESQSFDYRLFISILSITQSTSNVLRKIFQNCDNLFEFFIFVANCNFTSVSFTNACVLRRKISGSKRFLTHSYQCLWCFNHFFGFISMLVREKSVLYSDFLAISHWSTISIILFKKYNQ